MAPSNPTPEHAHEGSCPPGAAGEQDRRAEGRGKELSQEGPRAALEPLFFRLDRENLEPSSRQSRAGYTKVAPVDAIFQACDADLSGSLDLPQSQHALRALGFYPEETDLKEALKALGLDFPLTSPVSLQKVGQGSDIKLT